MGDHRQVAGPVAANRSQRDAERLRLRRPLRANRPTETVGGSELALEVRLRRFAGAVIVRANVVWPERNRA